MTVELHGNLKWDHESNIKRITAVKLKTKLSIDIVKPGLSNQFYLNKFTSIEKESIDFDYFFLKSHGTLKCFKMRF